MKVIIFKEIIQQDIQQNNFLPNKQEDLSAGCLAELVEQFLWQVDLQIAIWNKIHFIASAHNSCFHLIVLLGHLFVGIATGVNLKEDKGRVYGLLLSR